MHFRVLGPIEVSGEDGPLPLGGPKQRAVLAHLIVRANQVVSADALIDLVWNEDPPPAARSTLQGYVSHLRKAFGPDRLVGRPPGYVLSLDAGELDAAQFEALIREARASDGGTDRAGEILREALALWRGPAFADLAAEPALSGEIARLEELRLQALEERVSADLETGRHGDAIGELESLVREHPLRERLWASLMLALYRSGRAADSLATFQRAREILADELGADPSPELQRLHERVLRQDPDLDVAGEPLRGYRLLEQIGEGAFGVVYRGIQPQVGREVAVKSIHAGLANQPDFVRRFEREAQLVARIEHPHVVPLYDSWREPGRAFLVMRYLRGGTLQDLLAEGPLPVERIAEILDQVAAALAAAHRQGVVHRDVKPGNVLLDEEGNAYLSDFGIAVTTGAEGTAGTARGSPAYRSPEQIRREPPTPRSDLYALGVVLFEMLTGRSAFPKGSRLDASDRDRPRELPSARALRTELPMAVDAVVARATSEDPMDRYGRADELATAFRTAIAAPSETPAGATSPVRNPYKGLRAFLEADAEDFFGREALVRRLAERLARPGRDGRFLCVVGPSGSGKSSVVRAGLVPALRRGAVEGSGRWFVVDVMPGPHPLRQLESALLAIAVTPPPSLLEELELDELGLLRAVDAVLPDPTAELLIVLDQLEEIFTLVDEESERAHVLESLRAAVEAPRSRVRIVATLRADYFDQPLSMRGFGDLLAEHNEAITPMSPEQLERAIAGPAERVGIELERGLVAGMIADVAHRPGTLPLLQYALTELVEQETAALTMDAYRRIGGVSGALARRAEALFRAMNEGAGHACRQLFLRLVAIGEGTETTRRRVRRSALRSVADDRSMNAVIETFGRHRLLSFDRDPETREPTVEIAHEALLGEWDRLRDWIDASRDELRLHAWIAAAAAEWDRGGRSVDDLPTGTRLAQAEEAARGDSIAMTETERTYVEAGVTRREAERAAERARHEHQVRLERRSVRRLRALVAVLAVAALIAATLTAVAVDRSREAEHRREEAVVAALTGGVASNLVTDPELSIVLALHAVEASVGLGRPVPAETVEALHLALQATHVQYPVSEGDAMVIASPAGPRGVFPLPVTELVRLASARSERTLSADECLRYLGSTACPPLPSRFPGSIDADPIRPVAAAAASRPLAGTTVALNYSPVDPFVVAAVRRQLVAFTEETGIEVQLVGNPDRPSWLEEVVAAGNPPDIGFFPTPSAVASLGREGRLMDLGAYLDVEAMRADQSPFLVSLGTVGPDGTWPAQDGTTYGAFNELSVKSLIWYPVPELESGGYAIPQTWDELLTLSERLARDGRTPWCLGWNTGDPGGWPGTDWIENLILAGSGPATYDRWTFHEIGFDSPPVRAAFERLGDIVFPDGFVAGGAESGVVTGIFDAQAPMIDEDPPGCWLFQFPGFAAHVLPAGAVGNETDVFPFPSIGGGDATVLGGGAMFAAFADRPEVREVVRFLLSQRFAEGMQAEGIGFLSANRRFATADQSPFWQEQATLVANALATDSFRFDASDLMPPEIGSGVFWDAMMTYLMEGPGSLDRILAELDEAWSG
jgi:DNA-binding SARP family transcriptional activator/ABC-type glycerol-3-phosphate transport system substrate-binding protein